MAFIEITIASAIIVLRSGFNINAILPVRGMGPKRTSLKEKMDDVVLLKGCAVRESFFLCLRKCFDVFQSRVFVSFVVRSSEYLSEPCVSSKE